MNNKILYMDIIPCKYINIQLYSSYFFINKCPKGAFRHKMWYYYYRGYHGTVFLSIKTGGALWIKRKVQIQKRAASL